MKRPLLICLTWLLLIGVIRATLDIDGIWTGEDEGNISFQHIAYLPNASLDSHFSAIQTPARSPYLAKPLHPFTAMHLPAASSIDFSKPCPLGAMGLSSSHLLSYSFLISGLHQGRSPPLFS